MLRNGVNTALNLLVVVLDAFATEIQKMGGVWQHEPRHLLPNRQASMGIYFLPLLQRPEAGIGIVMYAFGNQGFRIGELTASSRQIGLRQKS
jgi:hypothetical protein